jgi:hypothetical protein
MTVITAKRSQHVVDVGVELQQGHASKPAVGNLTLAAIQSTVREQQTMVKPWNHCILLQ